MLTGKSWHVVVRHQWQSFRYFSRLTCFWTISRSRSKVLFVKIARYNFERITKLHFGITSLPCSATFSLYPFLSLVLPTDLLHRNSEWRHRRHLWIFSEMPSRMPFPTTTLWEHEKTRDLPVAQITTRMLLWMERRFLDVLLDRNWPSLAEKPESRFPSTVKLEIVVSLFLPHSMLGWGE